MELTKEEKSAISSLKRVAKKWPPSLWLFSASGTLCVIKKDCLGNKPSTKYYGVDQEYIVDTINIENDGGDW